MSKVLPDTFTTGDPFDCILDTPRKWTDDDEVHFTEALLRKTPKPFKNYLEAAHNNLRQWWIRLSS